MTRSWSIAEKIISITLLIWGGLLLCYSSRSVYYLLQLVSFKDLSVMTTVKNYYLIFLLPLATAIGGLLLLFGKRIGWIMSLITLFLNAVVFLIPNNRNDNSFNSHSASTKFYLLLIMICCLAALIVLLTKPFRTKYQPTENTWLTIAIVLLVVVLEKTLVFYFS